MKKRWKGKTWLQKWLQDWAKARSRGPENYGGSMKWPEGKPPRRPNKPPRPSKAMMMKNHGYPGDAEVWKARPKGDGPSGASRVPAGIEALDRFAALETALRQLADLRELHEPISAMKEFYLRGPKLGSEVMGISRGELYRLRDIGEAALMGYFKVGGTD